MKKLSLVFLFLFLTISAFAQKFIPYEIPVYALGTYNVIAVSEDHGATYFLPNSPVAIMVFEDEVVIGNEEFFFFKIEKDENSEIVWIAFKNSSFVWAVHDIGRGQLGIVFFDIESKTETLRIVVEKAQSSDNGSAT
ncbi:MAG TPA: hypothetical protein VMD05_07935 [Candidatus Nanoarchaeia archaeon]|nr:hypothetical protein [Candidatus Nanoarchaeia archaeon]